MPLVIRHVPVQIMAVCKTKEYFDEVDKLFVSKRNTAFKDKGTNEPLTSTCH